MTDVGTLTFPAVAFSPAGWVKEADEPGALRETTPDDNLSEWQGIEVYDSSGRKFIARTAYRKRPRTRLGLWICKLTNHSIYVGFDFGEPTVASTDELKLRLKSFYGEGHVPGLEKARTVQEVISLCCDGAA